MRELIDASTTLALLERYDRPGPRYTSYPTAVEFHDVESGDEPLVATVEKSEAPEAFTWS